MKKKFLKFLEEEEFVDTSTNEQIQFNAVISTPNLGLKQKLSEHFTIYNLDEFRTSMLNCKTEDKNENLYFPDKKQVVRKLHSVLMYQTEKPEKPKLMY